MPFIQYITKRFHTKSRVYIEKANAIIAEYQADGLALTLRQLYYQFVARDIFANKFANYRLLQQLVNDARLAGLMDWEAIEDRTRNLETFPTWGGPEEVVERAAQWFRRDKWERQKTHVEVWVEKDALLGVIERACGKWETPYFSCRGYVSQSEIWGSAMRLKALNKPAVVLHLSDHDPSGVDMSRDIAERFEVFGAHNVCVNRIALTMDQIRKLNPPPNPAKMTDSRAPGYVEAFGRESWELDALDPKTLINLIHKETEAFVNKKIWREDHKEQERQRGSLEKVARHWEAVEKFVAKRKD